MYIAYQNEEKRLNFTYENDKKSILHVLGRLPPICIISRTVPFYPSGSHKQYHTSLLGILSTRRRLFCRIFCRRYKVCSENVLHIRLCNHIEKASISKNMWTLMHTQYDKKLLGVWMLSRAQT